jgi:hypothetical protein
MKKYGIMILLSGLIIACEREVQVKIPDHEAKLVVHGQQAQDRFFTVRVGRSFGITETISTLNTGQFDVPDAVVLLKQNGIVSDTLKYNTANKRYEGRRQRALLGNSYSIEASANGFGKAEGNSIFPALVQPLGIALKRKARTDQNGDQLDEVTITFKDDGAKVNYYLFRIRRAESPFINCVITNDKDVERLVYSDPFYTEECLDGNRLLVNDKNFNGLTKTIVFYVNTYEMNEATNQQGRKLKPTVELLSINEDYYQYIKSVNSYDNAIDNPFAEPVNVTSNIKNGYGFFTTFALAVDTLR